MLEIDLLAVGTRVPAWVMAGVDEYAKRMSSHCRFNVVEIKAAGRVGNRTVEQCRQEEAADIRDALASSSFSGGSGSGSGRKGGSGRKSRGRTIALDMSGKHWSTEKLAGNLAAWSHDASHCRFVIGGPDGLDRSLVAEADEVFALSHLTFPHSLVRVLLAEQIYRALMINIGHPYHK